MTRISISLSLCALEAGGGRLGPHLTGCGACALLRGARGALGRSGTLARGALLRGTALRRPEVGVALGRRALVHDHRPYVPGGAPITRSAPGTQVAVSGNRPIGSPSA